jgi:hypothetical protein
VLSAGLITINETIDLRAGFCPANGAGGGNGRQADRGAERRRRWRRRWRGWRGQCHDLGTVTLNRATDSVS